MPEQVDQKELEALDVLLPTQKQQVLPMFLACKKTHGRNSGGNGPARLRQGSRKSSVSRRRNKHDIVGTSAHVKKRSLV